MVTAEQLKAYLRLPPDSTEDLSGYLAAARSKARTAGIPVFANNAQYDLFIQALAGMYYDNRAMSFSDPNAEAAAKRMIDAFVLELRYAEEDPEVPEPEEPGEPEGGEEE
jgi:hypothetical protein